MPKVKQNIGISSISFYSSLKGKCVPNVVLRIKREFNIVESGIWKLKDLRGKAKKAGRCDKFHVRTMNTKT
jgi:hypothetical protein